MMKQHCWIWRGYTLDGTLQWIESEKVREFVRRHYREDEKPVPVPQISP